MTNKDENNKLLEWIKKDYTANVMLSQTVSKHLFNVIVDIENQLKERFAEMMKSEDPPSLPVDLKRINWRDLTIKVFQEYSKIEI
jgi:hypothetical protein